MLRNARQIEFPYTFEKLGRVAKIKFWANRGIFGTYFRFAGKPVRNGFKTFEAAFRYLDHEFTKLDSHVQNSPVAFPIRGDLQTYHELEVLLKERTGGEATLREAVDYFLAHHETSKVQPRKVAECFEMFRAAELRRKVSPGHAKKTKSRLKNLGGKFGDRWIHSVSAAELEKWLQQFPNPKTSNHYRASAVSLFSTRYWGSNGYIQPSPLQTDDGQRQAGAGTKFLEKRLDSLRLIYINSVKFRLVTLLKASI
jgi:hypothetical protein